MIPRAGRALLAAGLTLAAGCAGDGGARSRGFVLVSVDTLRADRLGAYGYQRPTSPYFDELAGRGVLFENAFVQLPGTLPSHMSIFTGLYPAEHGVYPPDSVLAPDIRTLPEVLRAAGYRTGGFTEGGYVEGRFGFDRGFERFSDRAQLIESDVETTVARGLEFLRELAADDRFFLFLHTYVVHDPYYPPEPYRSQFWQGEPPAGTFDPTGPNLVAVNRGAREVTPEVVRHYEALYDASIRYFDDQLRRFWRGVEELGLAAETTLIVTSDHGEEFLEHGKLVHQQIYRESIHVPLLVVEPGRRRGARAAALVESVDIAPTLYELAGVAVADRLSGRSFAPVLRRPTAAHRTEAYAELDGDSPVRGLLRRDGDRLLHLVRSRRDAESGGYWVGHEAVFDAREDLELRVHTYAEPRTLEIEVDGRPYGFLDLALDRLYERHLPLGPGLHRVRLAVPSCTVPAELGESRDRRCLGFRLEGVSLAWTDLFDLDVDPREQRNLAGEEPELAAALDARLDRYRWRPVAASGKRELAPDLRQRLEALGYLR